MSGASSTLLQKITNAASMGPVQTSGASGSVSSTSNSNQQSLGSCTPSGGYIHWCVDEDRATIRLVDLDVKRFSDATLVKSLLGVCASVRDWANCACMGVAFIKVTDRVPVHVHCLADAAQFQRMLDENIVAFI